MSSTTRVLWPFLRRRWPPLIGAVISTIFTTIAQLATPWPLKLLIDHVLLRHGDESFHLHTPQLRLLFALAGLVLMIAAVDALTTYWSGFWLERAGESIVHDMRVALYSHLQRLSLAFHERRPTGDLVTRVTGDVNAVGSLFSDSLGTIVSALLLMLGMLIVSFFLDPVLTIASFAVTPLLAFVAFRYRRLIKSAAHRQRAREGEIASLATEALSSMRVVKALGAERFEQRRVRRTSEKSRDAGIDAARFEGQYSGLVDILGSIGAAVVLVVGTFRVAAGALTIGDLIVFNSYVRRVYGPLRDLARQASRVSRAMARADRVAEILAEDQVLVDRPGAFAEGRAHGDIELSDVSFGYSLERPILKDLSLHIAAGERVTIVGRSGAGKSTLIGLVARFYDSDTGIVLIDGRDVRDCKLRWLRDQIGLVLQETVLFTGTVAENIAYGVHAEHEAIVTAARAAGAHGFISELPEGYDTLLGPRGIGLSGGQRQRIAIARTLLRNPPILILDEPTTGLDAQSESQVLDGLNVLMRGRTTLIVTHSMALATKADRVVVIDNGGVSQEGAPEQLLARSGPLRTLARQQGLVDRPRHQNVLRDVALPTMAGLLDTDVMASALQRTLATGAVCPDVRIRYLRYKPGTSLVVHYDVGLEQQWYSATAMIASHADLVGRAKRADNIELARLASDRSPAPWPMAYDEELRALIQWLPLDLDLPALAQRPEELAERLRMEGALIARSIAQRTVLAYKPRRRATLRLHNQVIKIYAHGTEFERAAANLRSATHLASPGTPTFQAAVPDLRLTAQTVLVGGPVHPADGAFDIGEALAALHSSALRPSVSAPPSVQLEAAATSGRMVTIIAPNLEQRVHRLLARLEGALPHGLPLLPAHGDFHADQVLRLRQGLAFIDFDRMCSAPPALDVATYVAHLVRGEESEMHIVEEVLHSLVDGYGDQPADLSWYLASAILARAPFPFRYFDEHWPEQIEAMLETAEIVLDSAPDRAFVSSLPDGPRERDSA